MRITINLALSGCASVFFLGTTLAEGIDTSVLQQAIPYITRNIPGRDVVPMPPGLSMAPAFFGNFDPSGTNALVGSGFDSIASTVRADCVERISPLITILPENQNANGQDVRYDGKEITSLSQLRSILNISASASFSYGIYSGGGSFNLFQDDKFNAFSSYMYLNVEVTNMTQVLSQKNLTANRVSQLSSDSEAFQRACGDNYVSGITTGGLFSAIVKFDTKSEEHQRAVSAAINGAIAGFGQASGSVNEKFSSLEKMASFSIVLIRKGDQAPIPSLTELHKYALQFPDKVANGARPWVFNAITADYNTVDNLPAGRTPEDYASQNIYLEGLATLRDIALQVRNDLKYVLANPSQFEPHDQQQTQKDLSAATQKAQEILKKANGCRINPTTSCSGSYPVLKDLVIPKRSVSKASAKIEQAEELYSTRGTSANLDASLVILSTIDEAAATPEERYHAALLTAEALEWRAARNGIAMFYDKDKVQAYRNAVNKAVGLAAAMPSKPCEADFLAATEAFFSNIGVDAKQRFESTRDKMASLRTRSTRQGESCTKYLWAGIDRWTAYTKGWLAGPPSRTEPSGNPALWQEAIKAAEDAFKQEPDHPGNVYLWAAAHQDVATYCGILKTWFQRPIPESFRGLEPTLSNIKSSLADRTTVIGIYRDCPP